MGCRRCATTMWPVSNADIHIKQAASWLHQAPRGWPLRCRLAETEQAVNGVCAGLSKASSTAPQIPSHTFVDCDTPSPVGLCLQPSRLLLRRVGLLASDPAAIAAVWPAAGVSASMSATLRIRRDLQGTPKWPMQTHFRCDRLWHTM